MAPWTSPLFKRNKSLLSILIEPDKVTLALFKITASPLVLSTSTQIPVPKLMSSDLLQVPTLANTIRTFISDHSAQHTYAALLLTPPFIQEKVIYTSNKEPGYIPNMRSYHQFLYPTENKFCFYTSHVMYAQILEYQLLAHALSLNLLQITSANSARLKLYQTAHSITAQTMDACNNRIENLEIPTYHTTCLSNSTIAALIGSAHMVMEN